MKNVLIAVSAAAALLAGQAMAADGKAVYEKVCVTCHKDGVANAPKFGDKAAWADRIKTGNANMVKTVVTGKGAMPPRAGQNVSDDDIKAAVEYMVKAAK